MTPLFTGCRDTTCTARCKIFVFLNLISATLHCSFEWRLSCCYLIFFLPRLRGSSEVMESIESLRAISGWVFKMDGLSVVV